MNEWEEVAKEMRRIRAIKLLSPRELQVFALTGRGKTPVEMGIIMEISPITVASYRSHILQKMGMENQYQVMEYCIRADMDSTEFMNWCLSRKNNGSQHES